jgi:hypothetical protein
MSTEVEVGVKPGAGGSTIKVSATVLGAPTGDYSTASNVFVDVDAARLAITPTTAKTGDVLRCELMCVIQGTAAGDTCLTFNIAGVDVGDIDGLVQGGQNVETNYPVFMSYDYTMPSNVQPLIKARFNSDTAGSTAFIYSRADSRPRMKVTNLGPAGVF